jgi:predicted Zn-dependent peptidase
MFEKLIQAADGSENRRLPPDAQASANQRLEYHTNTQQAHICWGCKAFRYADERKYPLLVMHTLLGSGMSSRLFQRIREKHGLAYSVFSFIETYFDTGLFGVYAGTEPKQAEKALKMILDEVDKLTRKSISQSLLQRTKDQLKGNLVLGLESVSARMHRLAKMELYDAGWHSIDDVIRQIDGVTAGDVKAVAEELFGKNQAVTTMLLPN